MSFLTRSLSNFVLLIRPFHTSSSLKADYRVFQHLRTMPKERKHVPALKSQRKAKKFAQDRYPPAVISLQVLGSGEIGAPRALYVFTSHSRYLFNCGEASQRLAHEHKLKLAKLEHLFFTHNSWDNLGGLPGVALTIQDFGVPTIQLHGPPGLDHLFEAASKFVVLKDLEVSCVDASRPETSFQDNVMKVCYVPVLPSSSSASSLAEPVDETTLSSMTPLGNDGNSKEPSHKRPRMANPLPSTSKVAVNYVCELHPKLGVLLIEKCVELGVPVGPLLGQLKEGHDVTLDDGRLIHARDVCSEDEVGPIFLVVECPDRSYLDNFVTNEKLKAYHAGSAKMAPEVVVHFTPMALTREPEYVRWMEAFPDSTHHWMMGRPDDGVDQRRGLGSVAVHRIQRKLNLLDADVFPLLPADIPMVEEAAHDDIRDVPCQTMLQFHLRPTKRLDCASLLRLTPDVYVQECLDVDGFAPALDELKERMAQLAADPNRCTDQYPKVFFFGTGSQIPSKTRNTSAILVEIEQDRFMLMDCGEGTHCQLVRFFGARGSADVLANLVGVFISHLHADHHIGLIGLLQARQRAQQSLGRPITPITLIAPAQISPWLSWYDMAMEEIQQQFRLVTCHSLFGGAEDVALTEALHLTAVRTARVRHCPNAFGLALTTASGYKLTYSGDTMPCEELVKIGVDSDLLIHEATMEDGMEKEALLKTHSTTSQAIEVGRLMGAKFTLLTHFSQRYAKIPVFGDQFRDNVGVAFDNMRVGPQHLARLPHLVPALKLMFAEHYEDMEARTQRRQYRQKLLEEVAHNTPSPAS